MGDSAEVTGDRSRVVGYGAWAFYPIDAAVLSSDSRAALLSKARQAIAGTLGERMDRSASYFLS